MGPVEVVVRSMEPADVDPARKICNEAFSAFTGVPDVFGARDYVGARFGAPHVTSLAAELDGELVASNFVTRWGSFGFFGPLSVRTDLWDRGIARQLMHPTMQVFESSGTRLDGLMTFPHSPKHVGLYQRFGFLPGYLTAVMEKPIEPGRSNGARYSQLDERARTSALEGCHGITHGIFDGLDLTGEIRWVAERHLGEVVLVGDDAVDAFAVCHAGAGTEAADGACFVKFGAAKDATAFDGLIAACEAFGGSVGCSVLQAGVNTARRSAYARALALGFRTQFHGLAMSRPDDPGTCRPDVWAIDDWR